MKHYKYDFFCSLGLDCTMAGCVRMANTRSFSGPFDWLNGGTLESRINLINTEFKDFLNKDDLEEIIMENDNQPDKKRYKNTRTGLCFHHDWLAANPFLSEYISVKEKYDRRINRFMNLLAKQRGCLFVFDKDGQISKKELLKAADLLSSKHTIVCISNDESMKTTDIKELKYADNVWHYFINNEPFDFSVRFNTFLGNYVRTVEIIDKFKQYLRPIKKTPMYIRILVRFLACFIPSRKQRHKFRKKFIKGENIDD